MYQMKKITAALLFVAILIGLSMPADAQTGVSETVKVKAGEKIKPIRSGRKLQKVNTADNEPPGAPAAAPAQTRTTGSPTGVPGRVLPAPAPVQTQPQQQPSGEPSVKLSDPKMDAAIAEALSSGMIMLNFDNVDIKAITKVMAELTKKTIIVDRSLSGNITILSSRKVSLSEAWDLYVSALEASGYGVVRSGSAYKIVPIAEAKKESTQYIGTQLAKPGPGNVVALILLNNADSELMANTIRPMVVAPGVVASYGPSNAIIITDTAQNVSRLTQIARQLDSNYRGSTLRTYQPKYIRVKELATALQNVFQGTAATGQGANVQQVKIAAYEPTNTLIIMAPTKEFLQIEAALYDIDTEERIIRGEEKSFKVHYLKNASAEDVAKNISVLMEEKRKIVEEVRKEQQGTEEAKQADSFVSTKVAADTATNSLMFYITEKEYQALLPMIEMLDAEQKQILIMAIIAESQTDITRDLGAKWHVLDNSGFIGGFQGGLDQGALAQELTSGNFIAGGIGGEMIELTIGGATLKVPKIFGLIKALQTDNNFNLLSAPRIVTHDHKTSKLVAAQQLPFATGVKYDNNNQPIINYDYKDVGLDLEVTPHVGQNHQVRLEMKLSVKDLISWLQQGSGASSVQVPVISTRDINNTITLANGQTIVIGGLIDNKTTEVIKKVPFLHKIPLLGNLFQDTSKKTTSRTLFVFLTPHIINNTQELQQITDMYGRVIHKERGVNENVPTVIKGANERAEQ